MFKKLKPDYVIYILMSPLDGTCCTCNTIHPKMNHTCSSILIKFTPDDASSKVDFVIHISISMFDFRMAF